MTLQQLNIRVQQEADARWDQTIERFLHLLRMDFYDQQLLELQQRRLEISIRKCYCEELQVTSLCENCRDS